MTSDQRGFATALRVRDWDKRYENNRTRGLKRMEWVPVPNRMDGDGFTELMDHSNGITHFGCWNLCLQVASRCRPRGVLIRADGRPHDAVSLARMTRVPASTFLEAIPRLIEIGWLETFAHDAAAIPQEGAAMPHEGAVPLRHSDYGMEGNGREQNRREWAAVDDEKERLLQEAYNDTLTKEGWARFYEVCSDEEIEDCLGCGDLGSDERVREVLARRPVD